MRFDYNPGDDEVADIWVILLILVVLAPLAVLALVYL